MKLETVPTLCVCEKRGLPHITDSDQPQVRLLFRLVVHFFGSTHTFTVHKDSEAIRLVCCVTASSLEKLIHNSCSTSNYLDGPIVVGQVETGCEIRARGRKKTRQTKVKSRTHKSVPGIKSPLPCNLLEPKCEVICLRCLDYITTDRAGLAHLFRANQKINLELL